MGLFEAGQRILFGLGDMLEEAAHVSRRKLARVTFVVEQDQPARPVRTAIPWS
jgi:hypothetical protein